MIFLKYDELQSVVGSGKVVGLQYIYQRVVDGAGSSIPRYQLASCHHALLQEEGKLMMHTVAEDE